MSDLEPREVRRLEQLIGERVHREVFKAEIDNMKGDIGAVERKLDRMIETQGNSQRTAIWQLIMIIVTLVVAVIGAIGALQ